MKILSIIPARGGSKGIPLKNLKLVNGKPLISYTINASLNSKFIERTVVSTDHEKIGKIAKQYKANVIRRPKNISGDKAQLESTISNVLNYLSKNESYKPDLIVTLQNTSPLRTSKHIDGAIQKFLSGNYDSMLSASIFHSFLWKINKDQTIKPINYNPKKRPTRQQMKDQIHENGAIYITKYTSFKKTNQRLNGKIGFYEMPVENSFEIDSNFDLFLIEQILKENKVDR